MKKLFTAFFVVMVLTTLPAHLFAAEKLSTQALTLKVGAKKQLYINNVTTSVTVKWKSSNASVATVKNGLVTAKKKGTAKITATVNKKALTCKVTVSAKSITPSGSGEYQIGETWKVKGLWTLKINSVEETSDRNEFSDKKPKAVYIVTYTYKNLGYKSDIMDGLYLSINDKVVDAKGKMGYSYPGDVAYYPQETPIGATCKAQVCIGVDNPGSFKLYVDEYGNNYDKHSAVFNVKVD